MTELDEARVMIAVSDAFKNVGHDEMTELDHIAAKIAPLVTRAAEIMDLKLDARTAGVIAAILGSIGHQDLGPKDRSERKAGP